MTQTRILFVDDDDTFRMLLGKELTSRGYQTDTASSVREAVAAINDQEYQVAVVDLKLPDGDGLEVVRAARELDLQTELIVLTGHGSIDTAIEAMRVGAFDYLRKPCPIQELEVVITKALERRALLQHNTILRGGFAPPDMGDDFVGVSPQFKQLCELVDRVAMADSSVLILGETGVGKDVITKLLHSRSALAAQPLVVVECATLNEELLHNELFGHERGAFTGALQTKHGLFEVADGGTIFLDEIGDVSTTTQVKLLRVLETGRFRRVGGTKEIEVNVRVVAATNRDLQEMMARGFFRRDLFHRLSTIRVDVPPLRERPADVLALIEHFLTRLNARFAQRKRLGAAALGRLQAYHWPGNVRELLHALEHAVIMARADQIELGDLPPELRQSVATTTGHLLPLSEVEQRHILRVLEAMDGNRNRAADVLGISERTLYRKLKEYDAQ